MPREKGFSRELERQWLPFEPMLRFQPPAFCDRGPHGGVPLGGLSGTDNTQSKRWQRAWHRAKKDGRITVSMADELCVHMLHMHPAEVYGDLWWAE